MSFIPLSLSITVFILVVRFFALKTFGYEDIFSIKNLVKLNKVDPKKVSIIMWTRHQSQLVQTGEVW